LNEKEEEIVFNDEENNENEWVDEDIEDIEIEDIEIEDDLVEEELVEEEEICFDTMEPEDETIQEQEENNAEIPEITNDETTITSNDNDELIKTLQSTISSLQAQIQTQESQLTSQAESMSTLTQEHFNEKSNLESQIQAIKDEAKKRISRAKDRVTDITNDLQSKDKIIVELRSEGEKLSIAKGTIEQLCKQTKNELKELQTDHTELKQDNESLTSKLNSNKVEIDSLKKDLNDSKKYIDKCTSLEHTVHMLKEENTTLIHQKQTQQEQIQQLQTSLQEYQQEVQQNDALKQIASSKEIQSIHKDKEDMRNDFEKKLRLQEREANNREDALRKEMEELRKRWQDAVRRADVLSMDVQNATAPLVRQLESTERSMRVRASTAAELEQKLRRDLEDKILEYDAILREKNELQSQVMVLNRKIQDIQSIYDNKSNEQTSTFNAKLLSLEQSLQTLQIQNNQYQTTIDELQHSIVQYEKNSSVMKEYILQKETIQELTMQVKMEEGKRIELERQLEDLQTHYTNHYYSNDAMDGNYDNNDTPAVKLHEATNQADILKNLVQDDDDEDNDAYSQQQAVGESSASNSFAAMEQLTQNLSNAIQEIHTLRTQLQASETIRNKLQEEMKVAKSAQEKLPFFESKVLELTNTLAERELETKALHEDILDIKEMYRSQLDALLEEKAAWLPKVDVVDVVEEEIEHVGKDMEVNLEIAFNGDIVAES